MIPESDLKIERIKRSKSAGGQHNNKVASCVRVTHLPTGIQVEINGRDQHRNLREALQELERRLAAAKAAEKAAGKKARRDKAIHDTRTIRTYDLRKGVVKDHRTKKTAPAKDVLEKGKLELLK